MSTVADRSLFGEFQNVQLSIIEHQKLTERYGPETTGDYIERLSCWLKNTRKRRPSHYACILTWIRKDGTIAANTRPSEPLIEEAELRHRAEILRKAREREGLFPNSIEDCVAAIRRLDASR